MTVLYKRLSIKKKQMPIEIALEGLNRSLKMMNKRVEDIDIYKSEVIYDASLIAFYYFYLEQLKEAQRYAKLTIDYALDYFFGSWRWEIPYDNKTPDVEKRKNYGTWEQEYRYSVFWASCLGDWDSVKSLSKYPTDECPIGRYETKYECKWLLTLAAVIRGEPLENLKKYTNSIDKGRSKYHKLLLEMLRAICEKSSERFNLPLKVYLDFLQENVFDPPEVKKIELEGSPEERIEKAIKLYSECVERCKRYYGPSKPEKVAVEGTFLINFARREGLQVEYPAEYEDRIVKLQK